MEWWNYHQVSNYFPCFHLHLSNFRYSGSCLKVVTKMLVVSFYCKCVRFLPLDQVPLAICNDPKLYPYFKDCHGAIDGSQFNSWVQDEATVCCCNWKGFISQNVLAICDWDLIGTSNFYTFSAGGRVVLQTPEYLNMQPRRTFVFLVDIIFLQTLDFLLAICFWHHIVELGTI